MKVLKYEGINADYDYTFILIPHTFTLLYFHT